MRSFCRPLSSVEQPAARSAPSSVAQPAETITSLEELKRWLDAQGESSELQRLHAAVLGLTKTHKHRRDVSALWSAWKVRQYEQRQRQQLQRRPLETLISELQQVVMAEGNRLRNSLGALTGATASSVEQAEQLAVTSTAAERAVKRPMEAASVEQLDPRAKAPRKGASSASASSALIDADAGEASATQTAPKSKQRRLTAMFPAAGSQRAGAATSSSERLPGLREVNNSAAQPGQPTKQQRLMVEGASSSSFSSLAERPEPLQHSILEYGARTDDLAEVRRAMGHLVKELERLSNTWPGAADAPEKSRFLTTSMSRLRSLSGERLAERAACTCTNIPSYMSSSSVPWPDKASQRRFREHLAPRRLTAATCPTMSGWSARTKCTTSGRQGTRPSCSGCSGRSTRTRTCSEIYAYQALRTRPCSTRKDGSRCLHGLRADSIQIR